MLKINNFYGKIYLTMSCAIGISGLFSWFFINKNKDLLLKIQNLSLIATIALWILPIILVEAISKIAFKNPKLALPIFFIYSGYMGFLMGTTLMLYTATDITIAFISTFLMFVIMGLIGFVTKKDLSGIGKACIASLCGVIIAILLNFIFHSSMLSLIISIISVVIFACLIAYDNNRIRNYYEHGETSQTIVILMALNLYLDFLNMFSSILNIIGFTRD